MEGISNQGLDDPLPRSSMGCVGASNLSWSLLLHLSRVEWDPRDVAVVDRDRGRDECGVWSAVPRLYRYRYYDPLPLRGGPTPLHDCNTQDQVEGAVQY